MDCFTYGWLEKAAFDKRAQDMNGFYQLGDTMDHVVTKRVPLPKKQAQRLRLGGEVIHLSTNFYSGSFTAFKEEPKTGLWNDARVFGCYRSKNYEMVAIVFPLHSPGTVVLNAHQHQLAKGGVILFDNAVEGSLTATLSYHPKKMIWDYLLDLLKRLDSQSPVPGYYFSKVVKVVVETQCITASMWNENCEILWGKKMKAIEDPQEKVTLAEKNNQKSKKSAPEKNKKKPQQSVAEKNKKKSQQSASLSSMKKAQKKPLLKRPSVKK